MLELPILKQEIYGCWRMVGDPENSSPRPEPWLSRKSHDIQTSCAPGASRFARRA